MLNNLKLLFLALALMVGEKNINAQSFLNGSFENNSSGGVDQINMTNAAYNAMMANSVAFGTTGDMDILTNATYGAPQDGTYYVALTGGGTDAFSLKLSTPMIAGASYTVSFYDRAYSFPPFVFEIGLSTVDTNFGTNIYTAPSVPAVGVWTLHTFTFTAPNNGQYITVQGNATLSTWGLVDNFSILTPTDSIVTGTITGSPFCACSTVDVPFISTGTFMAGNIYTAELSDASGSFASPVTIGTLASTANAGTIFGCVIPCNTPSGTGYRIRVLSSSPVIIGSDNGIDLTITASVIPDVSISSTGSIICAGDSVSFTATPTNGGTSPGYQWQVNGTSVGGATASTFTTSTLADGDSVNVILTSNAACAFPLSDTSTAITITVASAIPASVTITSSGSTICPGDPVTFTALPTNGGVSPTYQWQLNGSNVGGATSSTYTTSALSNGDVVTCVMTSGLSCATGSPATSNPITITVSASVVASVSIAASPTGAICAGQSVTFTATPTNGGTTPTYQWQVNGANIGGATSSTYTTTTLANGDIVTCIMTSSSNCATGSPATSNAITMIVNSTVAPAVTITGTPTTICLGDPVTFNATPTNGGSAPSYQWQVNSVNAGTNSSVFTSTSLTNGAIVTVIMTSNLACASPTIAVSNTVIITVNNCNQPVANFSGTPRVMCQSGCVNFTDLSTNNPTSWSWQFPGASPATSTSQNPTNICYSSTGSYDVTLIVSNAGGSDTLTEVGYIIVGDTTQVNITGNLAISSCEKTELTAVPSDGTYSWGPNVNLSSTSGATVIAAPPSTQQYWVTYTSPDGCTDSDTVTVVVTDINTYFLPTALTPNGDGINDEIHLHGRSIESFTLKIFDRIGEQVFQTTSMEKGWDGRLLGVPMNDGVFVYILNITFCNGEKVKKYGDITLVK